MCSTYLLLREVMMPVCLSASAAFSFFCLDPRTFRLAYCVAFFCAEICSLNEVSAV